MNKTFDGFQWELKDIEDSWPWLDVELDSKNGVFELRLVKKKGDRNQKVKIGVDDLPNYKRALKQWIYCLKTR